MKRRFLILTSEASSHIAGDSKSAILLTDELKNLGVKSTIISYKNSESWFLWEKDSKGPIISQYFGVNLWQKIISRVLLSVVLLYYGINVKSWIIYGKVRGNRIAILAGWLLGKRVIFRSTLWGYDNISTLVSFRKVNRIIYSLIWGYWALNPLLADDFKATFPSKKRHRIFTSQQGVPVGFRQVPIEKKLDLRRKHGIPNDLLVIIMVGHVIERKGFPAIFDSLARLESDFLLLVVGMVDPEINSRLLKHSSEMKSNMHYAKSLLNDKVRFLGWVNYVEEYLNISDIFLHAAYSEGFPPNSLNEAIACGLPCVVRRIPGVYGEYLENNAVLFFENEQEMRYHLTTLMVNESLRSHIRKCGGEWAIKHLDISDIAKKLLVFIEKS